MSIKKLFQSTDTSRNYLSDTNQKDAFKDVESAKNVSEVREKQTSFIPPLDYSKPKNFVKYGSANLYYKSAIERIIDYFPYDGSDAEINGFYNESLNIEKYIFDNDYPRTNGYALFSADSWGDRSGAKVQGYGLPASQEYIEFKGGPNTITSSTTAGLFEDPETSSRNSANIYDTNIYTTAGLESNYGTGSRESNLECNFDKGVTLEFWLKKDDFDASKTAKEVICDIWTGVEYGNDAYGRILLSINGAAATSPFILTVYSGSTGFAQKTLGSSNITATSVANGAWQHYAVTMQNSGSGFVSKLYLSGALDDIDTTTSTTLGILDVKADLTGAMIGRLGALVTGPPTIDIAAGAGKLSASMDEFRFWKAARNGAEIYKNWFTQVRGGTNTDISNTTLGVYYKFNEGITGTASIDNSVLDYSGRITNGNWIGYDSDSRSLNSAIVQSSASATEYKDPIIRSNNPDVISLKNTLERKGSDYDFNNNASFESLIPSWVVEEANSRDGQYVNPNPSNIEMVSHVLGTYFDNLRLMIQSTPKLRYLNYASASNPPTAFAQHLPQSLGLYMPEIFVDANVMEKFLNRTDNTLFEGDLTETKNLIYQNIYNNLTNIYKSKGTEKAIRNVLRCFNIDDKLIRLNVYSDKQVYELKNNLRQTLVNQKMLNFNESANVGGVVYQARPVMPQNYLLTENWWSKQAYTAKSSLVGWWRLNTDIATAGSEADSSGNGHTATAGPAPDWPDPVVTPSTMIQANTNYFDGTTSGLSVSSANALSFTDGSGTDTACSFHFRFNGTFDEGATSYYYLAQKGDGTTTNSEYRFYLYDGDGDGDAVMTVKFYDAGGDYIGAYTTTSLNSSQWYDVVVTYDGSENSSGIKVYVDGVEVATTTSESGTYDGMSRTGEDLYLGARVTSYDFKGYLGDVAVWNSILSPTDIKALYNAKEGVNANSYVTETFGYISGSEGVGVPDGVPYESKYGFTAEADVIFPNFADPAMPTSRQPTSISLFGMQSASTDNTVERPLNDTTWYASDNASFQVFALRDEPNSKNVKFQLTSAFGPDVDQPFPVMASETFYDVYDDQAWNFSVRLKPSQWPLAQVVTGATAYTYDVIFKGINAELGVVRNSFELSSSISQTLGQNFLKAAKRLYVGALKHNLTGSLSSSCDVVFEGARYWLKYLDDLSLNQHAYDIDNYGISGSYQYTSPFDINLQNSGSVLNSNMLALNWNFSELSASNVNGGFTVTDISSGSTEIRNNYGWVGEIAGYQMAGSGSGWSNSSQTIIQSQSVNAYQFINPEIAVSSDMIQILSEDDTYFGVSETPPQFTYLLEKSMYNAISEEMLNFFAGVVDFNNVIGEPINRYRGRYKTLEKLREIFFRRVTEVKQVEKFIEYYKWFDDAIAEVIGQLLPASGDFTPDAYNTIESHVLERNKYRSKFPMLNYEEPTVEGLLASEDAGFGSSSPAASSPRPTNKHEIFWKNRALRTAPEITSGDATVDSQRDNIRKIAASFPTVPQALPNFKSVDGTTYKGMQDVAQNAQNEKLSSTLARRGSGSYWGGVNFQENKNIQFTYNALYAGGPVNTDNNVFVPKNVLMALTDDLEPLDEITANVANFPSSRKLKRVFGRVQHGRDWEDGSGYANTKSTYSFPFNIMSSSVVSGYNKLVVNKVTSSIEVTNLHNDVYGPDMEVPMQGPFTDHNVGGHQSRHVAINTGSVLDTYLTRPEAWKLLLGKCPNTSGAIGMAGVDYPWPEANDAHKRPYPMTASQKAIYYRGFVAKRPVNIRNITSSMDSVLGNYTHAAQVVQSVGAYSTPRHFLEYQPPLPTPVVNLLETVPSASTNVVGFFPWIRRTENSHFNWDLDYAPVELTGTTNKTVFVGRFAAPGGPDVMSRGFLDIRGAEYSPYNALPWRNLSVLRPWQPPSGTISQATGSGVPGIRVYDIHGKSYGLNGLLARHSARFGRDSIFETASPGATYNQLPSFQQNNRNRWVVIKSSSTAYADDSGYSSGSQFDNAYVVHPIPRSDRQYSWFTSSLVSSSDVRYYRFQPTGRNFPYDLFSGSSGYVDYFDFITGSVIDTSVGMFQPTTRLNIFTLDPVTGSTTNVLGYPSTSAGTAYFNSQLIEKLSAADSNTVTGSSANYFNLLMTRRGNTYGWNWQKLRQNDHPILVAEATGSTLSLTKNPGKSVLSSYSVGAVSLKGRPVLMNIDAPASTAYKRPQAGNNLTLKASDNNRHIYFNNIELDNHLIDPKIRIPTAYDGLTRAFKRNRAYSLQWVLYSQGVYPSDPNEMLSRTTTRTDYNNEFWRNIRTGTNSRATVGNAINNSFSRSVSQSCWAIDAQDNFLTRTATTLPTPSWNSSSSPGYDHGLIISGAAGEMQNNYFFYWDTEYSTGGPVENKYQVLSPSALYARKHMLQSPKSVSPWTNIPETGSNPNIGEFSTASMEGIVPEPYAGEALWEADTQAGRVIKSGSQVHFEVTSSKPWFGTYDDFRYDLKLLAKDYSIIPEFRISEHVDDYINYGILNQTNTFEIPGTTLNSTQDNFYKDYSNSEFMKEFSNVPSETRLKASEIRLVMSAAIRFNPYKGFYPAQRSMNLVTQFSKSYGAGLMGKKQGGSVVKGTSLLKKSGSLLRPLIQPLFAPGILYNTMKGGIAVDYPTLIDATRFIPIGWTGSSETTNDWALLHANATNAEETTEGYNGGEWYDLRIPFEAILEPESHIKDVAFIDCEPHPSVSLDVSSSFAGESDGIYSKMSTNFFGEIANFFLKNQEFSTLKSGIITDDLKFERGDIFGARIVMQRAWDGDRTYGSESGSNGSNASFTKMGALAYSGSGAAARALRGSYPLPQDPIKNVKFKPLFVPYTRPTAYGPPVAGRPAWGADGDATVLIAREGDANGVRDFANGHAWAYTPPYFYGEAWCDLIFRPTAGETYSLERILSETSAAYWRADPGVELYASNVTKYALIPKGATGSNDPGPPYGGANVNANAMQLSASVNIFGVERVTEQTLDEFGNLIMDTNKSVGKKWVIQSKFETPMMNFSDNDPVHPISTANSTLTLPTYGSASVPRGMWHQFGVPPTETDNGIFLKIGDIPTNWLKYHYDVITNDTIYNDNNAGVNGKRLHKKLKSLAQLTGFERNESKTRLGELASQQIIREAVVAVPYTTENIIQSQISSISGEQASQRKKFISIPKERFQAAMSKNTATGDSLDAAGISIRELVQKMGRYVLPPQFDFINNPDIRPMVMYMFEFEYELDQDDLAYIWQNLAPRDYQKISLESYSVAHELINTELLDTSILEKENLRWMVFKIKQRASSNYYDKIVTQVGESSENIFNKETTQEKEYEVMFNWPYDYISIVEMAKLDVQILYKN